MAKKEYMLSIAVVVAVLMPTTSVLAQWYEYNGHSYALTSPGDWHQAEAIAVLAGGHLATVNSTAENQWLYDTFHSAIGDWAWIGFYQDPDDPAFSEPAGGWKWISGEPITYVGWFGQDPNNQGGAENWAVLEGAGPPQWNDLGPTSQGYPVGGVPGIVEIVDCNGNAIPDEIESDVDDDGVIDACDNCPTTANLNQVDGDGDGVGNVCDNCPSTTNPTQIDSDNDGIGDACDNCPTISNPGQENCDGDSMGDACDPDDDNDGVPDAQDVCPCNKPGLSVDCHGRPLRDCNGDCRVDGLDVQCIVNELLGL